jgi:DNA-binding transcriptional regulator YdaS (Cro superfamily)
VPFQCALDIEGVTSGQVTCYELVPRWDKAVECYKRNKKKTHTLDSNDLTNDYISENNNTSSSIQDQETAENNLIDLLVA